MSTSTGAHPGERTISRRRVLGGGIALAGAFALARPLGSMARVASEAAAADVTFTITADAIKGPAEVVAGINRVTLANQTGQNGVHCLTMQLPDGTTLADVETFAKASAEAGDEGGAVPDWWLKATMVGNPDWPPAGGVSDGYVSYPAGTYVIMNIFGSQWTSFTVKEGATAAEPDAAVNVETKLMSFTGLDGIAAGRHLWKITNTDMVAHELAIARVPSATTTVPEIIDMFMAAPNFPDGLPKGYAMLPGGTGIITPGVSMWLQVDLPAGDYAAVCFAPDGWNGPPHALMGMIKVFSVA